MITTYNKIKPQIEELLHKHNGMIEVPSDYETNVILSGIIFINRIYNNYIVNKKYEAKIVIPLNNYELPKVFDVGNHIDTAYEHRYEDGELCLDTNAYIALCFHNGYSLLQWMENIVEPYYYSYEYYTRFDKYPFGDRSHGNVGVIEAYQDIFKVNDGGKVCEILLEIINRRYRGHLPCPCGSGLKTRQCHGKHFLPFICNEQLNKVVEKDVISIYKELIQYDNK